MTEKRPGIVSPWDGGGPLAVPVAENGRKCRNWGRPQLLPGVQRGGAVRVAPPAKQRKLLQKL